MLYLESGGDFFELEIAGYAATPAETGDPFFLDDANWLMVRGRRRVHGKTVEGSAACLLVEELEDFCAALRRWQDNRAQGLHTDAALYPLEPDLSLFLASDGSFEAYFLPEGAREDPDDPGIFFCERLPEEDVEALVDFCAEALARCPRRKR